MVIFSIKLQSQEISSTVFVNMEQLSQEARVNLSTIEKDLTNYLNSQKYSNVDWVGPKIPINLTIFISSGSNGRYTGKLVFISKRNTKGTEGGTSSSMKIFEDNISFDFSQGASFTLNPQRCDKFISIIDFYTYLALGLDFDSYGDLEGTKLYEVAKTIANNCRDNADGWQTFSQPGDFTRYNLVSEMLNPNFEQFRKLIYTYHVDGLDKMESDRTTAMKNIQNFIADLADFKNKKLSGSSVFLQAFFDAKAMELITIFKGTNNQQVLKDLKYLDPSNTTLYNDNK